MRKAGGDHDARSSPQQLQRDLKLDTQTTVNVRACVCACVRACSIACGQALASQCALLLISPLPSLLRSFGALYLVANLDPASRDNRHSILHRCQVCSLQCVLTCACMSECVDVLVCARACVHVLMCVSAGKGSGCCCHWANCGPAPFQN